MQYRAFLHRVCLALAGVVFTSPLAAATYYVATNGDDARTATQAQNIGTPWKTIQKAASTMVAGDVCQIRAGTYRETATVAASGTPSAPITFQAYGSEVVTISGLDTLTGWTAEAGVTNSWYATLTGSLGDSNQVFQNGAMKPEARWPNAGAGFPWQDSSIKPSPDWAYTDQVGYTNNAAGWFTDSQLPTHPDDYWKDCTVHIMTGYGWIMQFPAVSTYTDSLKKIVTTDANGANAAYAFAVGNEYYITGKKEEMDSSGEWFYQSGTSRLFFYSTASPTGVEVKKRYYGFDLRGRSYVKLVNLDFFACTIQTDGNSTFATFDGLYMRYLGHSRKSSPIFGLQLRNNSTLRNSELCWDSRALIQMTGNDIKIFNNNLHDSGYVSGWEGMIDGSGFRGFRNLINHNSLHEAGRACMSAPGCASIVEYNDMYHAQRLATDGGVLHNGNTEASNTIFRYNLLHDSAGAAGHLGASVMGFYLDNFCSNWVVHHNIIWGVPGNAMHVNNRHNFNLLFNNTCRNTGASLVSSFDSYVDGETGTHVYNNLFDGPVSGKSWDVSDLRYNLFTDPLFVAGTSKLQAGSPAIDQGTVIPGVTDGFSGAAPALGALEYGGTDWTTGVGYSTTPPAEPTYSMPAMVFAEKVQDTSFESGAFAPNWVVTGTSVVINNSTAWVTGGQGLSRSGVRALKFTQGTSEVKQTITGLLADRRYKLYVATQTADAGAVIKIGIRNYGYSTVEMTLPAGSGVWEMNNLPFVTGATNSTADIYVSVTSTTTTPVYVDDIGVLRSQEAVPVPQRTPIVHYTFDQSSGTTVTDGSINGLNGSVSGAAAPSWQAGKVGNALGFDGVDDSVQTPSLTTPAAFTVACWAKSPNATWGNNWGCFFSQRPSFFFTPYPATKNLRFTVYSSPTASLSMVWSAPASFDITAWHHYAAVFSPTEGRMKIYVDGEVAATGAAAITLNPDTGPIYIGKDEGYTDRQFLGVMDDARIYDRALSSKEIAEIADPDPALVFSYAFDEASGSTKGWDGSGHARNGTLTNMATSTCWVDGEVNGAVGFDGVDDYVSSPAINATGALTVACWAKSNTATWNAYGCLIAQRPSFVLHPEQGSKNVRFIVYNTPTTPVNLFWTAPANFDITTWHHYAGVFSPSTQKMWLYVDGVAVNSTTATTINADNGAVFIGKDDYTGRNFGGQIDDVRVYFRDLSSWEMMELSEVIDAAPYY
jgi:hypothetical protein